MYSFIIMSSRTHMLQADEIKSETEYAGEVFGIEVATNRGLYFYW